MLHGLCCGEEAGARNLVISVYSGCRRRRSKVPRLCGGCGCGRFCRKLVPPLCSATSGCVFVRSSMRVLKLWLQIALEWLRQGCFVLWLHV